MRFLLLGLRDLIYPPDRDLTSWERRRRDIALAVSILTVLGGVIARWLAAG